MFEIAYSRITFYDSATHGMAPKNKTLYPGMKELATLTWVDWYNKRRLLGRLGHTPPAEAEKAYYASIGNNDLAA